MKIHIAQQRLRKRIDAKQRRGNSLIRPCGVSPFQFSFADEGQVFRSKHWPVFSPHARPFFHAKLLQLREIKKQAIQLSNSENWKFTHGQNTGLRANINKVAVRRNRPYGFAKGGKHLINGSLKRAAKNAHLIMPLKANSSERMGDRKLADKCKPIRADFEFNEFPRGSPPKLEKNPSLLFESKFTDGRS